MSVSIHVKSPALRWSIGANAAEYIKKNGFGANDIDLMLGAAGGPKWLVLSGLDRAVFTEFMSKRTRTLPVMASSVGTWRFACMAQDDPSKALSRFLDAYLQQCFPKKVTPTLVAGVVNRVLNHLLGDTGVSEILKHPHFRTHVLTIRCRKALQSDNPWPLSMALGGAFIGNLLTRKSLGLFFERAVFSDNRSASMPMSDGIPTLQLPLTHGNMELALQASGAVPLVISGVESIPDAVPGVYRDGGVTDYHFDHGLMSQHQLVFYPHFYSHCIPGWFDKVVKWRHQGMAHWPNTVFVSPSDHFVDSLPYGKIPDRKDFYRLTDQERQRYWRKVADESERLGDAFLEAIEVQRFDG